MEPDGIEPTTPALQKLHFPLDRGVSGSSQNACFPVVFEHRSKIIGYLNISAIGYSVGYPYFFR
jgi:hypothetical protein